MPGHDASRDDARERGPDGPPDVPVGDPRDDRPLDAALREGARVLAAAGVGSARTDVELLAAHLLGPGHGRGEVVTRAALGDRAPAGLAALVDRRAARVPLQHLTGTAPFRSLELAVGPGVFVPRPETEQVAEVAIVAARDAAGRTGAAVVVDLCTGSGAIALAVWTEVPDAVVHAVELDATAHRWARRNLDPRPDDDAGSPPDGAPRAGVHLVRGDARTALGELDGRVDVVVSNPPYVPPGAVPRDPEVRDHDPAVALYGLGPDGLAVPRGVVAAAARLLRPGGVLVMEHAEAQARAVRDLALATGAFEDVRTATDLAGRDRMVVAHRAAERAEDRPADRAVDRGPVPGVKDSRP